MTLTICIAKRPDGSRCGAMTSNARFCDDHLPFGARLRQTPSAPARRTYRWQKLARSFRQEWVQRHGWTCAGYRRGPHPVPPPRRGERSPLHVDHVTALARGGAAFDRRNLQCLCASCNGRKSGHGQ